MMISLQNQIDVINLNQMKKQAKSGATARKEFGDYLIGKTIGEGTFGKVKAATHKLTGESVAIKILEKSKISQVADVQRVSREIHILKLIRHPNIVQLYEIIETPKQLFLVMEYMQNGELFDYIVAQKRINENQARRMFHELIDGVEYIHRIGVVHRDLKPENILIDYKQSIKVVDFGLSNTYRKNQLLKTPCGSPCYAAPEMIRGEKYNGLGVDLWSCGVILFAMLCGYLPFEDPDTPALYKKILSGTYTLHKSLSSSACDLIGKILENDHSVRLSIDQIRSHPWMQNKERKTVSDGIIVGFNKIPIDNCILQSLKQFGLEPDHVAKCLQANRHNNATTAYYLALKKHVRKGGASNCDLSSAQFDKSILEPNRRKSIRPNVVVDNFFTRNSDGEVGKKRKSKEKSRDKSQNKENKITNFSTHHLVPESRKRVDSKNKINSSFNYGRVPLTSKSVERNYRQSVVETQGNRKVQESFNQSLISKSKERQVHQRSRINSSINGMRRQLPDTSIGLMDGLMQNKKAKKVYSGAIKSDTSKIIRARRL